ncbi:MAG: hypothetical protein ACLPWO_05850 [Thermoplasmata archaeon]
MGPSEGPTDEPSRGIAGPGIPSLLVPMDELARAADAVEVEVGVVIPAHGLEGDALVRTSPTATPATAATATTITTSLAQRRMLLTASPGDG